MHSRSTYYRRITLPSRRPAKLYFLLIIRAGQ
jgi:hypothetical protein